KKERLILDIDLRKAILHNIKENTPEELEATIVDAISLGEEKVLPGLGYLFEMIWKQSEEEERALMNEALAEGVKEEQLIYTYKYCFCNNSSIVMLNTVLEFLF